jgi:hypothetical protein
VEYLGKNEEFIRENKKNSMEKMRNIMSNEKSI